MTPKHATYLRRELLRWYDANKRDLPWRETSEPYCVWVSEIMLQQTRVAAVIEHYKRFLSEFPDVKSLAHASIDDVLAQWSGLGYYRRARHLKAGAEAVMEHHDGVVPSDEDSLLALPGIGRYTAGAIRSIAFGLPAPILDGNVFRVVARFFEVEGSWISTKDKKEFWEIAAQLVPSARPGDYNQAMMEWGAMICTPVSPGCSGCPVRKQCGALASGRVGELPTPRVKEKPIAAERTLYVLSDRTGRLLMRRRPNKGRMAGMLDLLEELPAKSSEPQSLGSFKHSILNKRYEVTVYSSRTNGRTGVDESWEWIAREKIGALPLTTMAKKGIKLAQSISLFQSGDDANDAH